MLKFKECWVAKDASEEWYERYFKCWDGDMVVCYNHGRSSMDDDKYYITRWKFYKKTLA